MKRRAALYDSQWGYEGSLFPNRFGWNGDPSFIISVPAGIVARLNFITSVSYMNLRTQ